MTGVLPISLMESTKISQALLHAGKEYVAVMRLHGQVGESEIQRVLVEFTGKIFQKPPLRSSVRRSVRTRTIYYIEDVEIESTNVLFRVGCEAGTYIRKLCHDLGEVFGVGAHMAELRRTRVGSMTEDKGLVTLFDLKRAFSLWEKTGDEALLRKVVLPVEEAIDYLPKLFIRDTAVDAICHGADLAVPGIVQVETGVSPQDMVAVLTLKGEIIALSQALMSSAQMLEAVSGKAADTLRVVMAKGTYPRTWRSHS